MGLTLNTNSLTIPSTGGSSAASGLSTSDVTTLIKSNTPYQHIATLTADSSSFLEYTSLPSEYRTFRIIYDALRGNVNQYLRIRLYFDGSEHTSNNYRYGGSEELEMTALLAHKCIAIRHGERELIQEALASVVILMMVLLIW